jgi:hypothetical protein
LPSSSDCQEGGSFGYGLGDGMLFRGELIDGCTEDDARRHCTMVANNWIELDAEDEQAELETV